MIPPIGAVNYDVYSPYSMYGMGYGMGMYGMMMPPQNLEQYRNMQKVTTDLFANQASFAGKVNPLFSGFNNSERTNFSKSLNDYSVNSAKMFSPYSNENIDQTKDSMNAISQLQMQMMVNPFAMYGGSSVMV